MWYLALLEIHLHFPTNGSLKGKRKELSSLKAQLRRRFGASVSETDHHDLWQRATLSAALVGRDAGAVSEAGREMRRYVERQYPDGVSFDQGLASVEEVIG
jgi:uncharacterized protein YlxP (DUF503 family)